MSATQLILWLAPAVSNEGRSSPLLVLAPPFLGPGFRLGARWNRLGQAVKTRKKREKTGGNATSRSSEMLPADDLHIPAPRIEELMPFIMMIGACRTQLILLVSIWGVE